MADLQDYLDALGSLVPGTHPLGDAEKTKAVGKALATHSKYKPLRIVEDVIGTGEAGYALSDLLSAWDEDFSGIQDVQCPVDADGRGESLDAGDWDVIERPTGKSLLFSANVPAQEATFRVIYTARHGFTGEDDASTVPAADEEAVHSLAASFYCRMLAAAYAQDQDSTIHADSVDHSSKRREYEAQAAKYRAEYDEHIGAGKKETLRPACRIQDQDVSYPWGSDRLTHPSRWR